MTDIDLREPIPGHSTYSITPDGDVFSRLGKRLKWNIAKGGYPTVSMSSPKRTLYVAKTVAAVFLGEVPAGHRLNYIDGDPGNPALPNLEYVRIEEDVPYSWQGLDWPTALEIEYERQLGTHRLMQVPDYYRKARRIRPSRWTGHWPD